MTDLVPADEIEDIVGHQREWRLHYGRAVSSEQTMYILHSKNCLSDTPDLRECEFSVALDHGLDMDLWESRQDKPVALSVVDGRLYPGIIAGTEG